MDTIEVPATFPNIIRDFTADLTTTFPEYAVLWRKWQSASLPDSDWAKLFQYCCSIYPERFFDILYQNADIFCADTDPKENVNTRFLPAVEFKTLYFCEGVSDTTRDAIWKYLQLILMTVINSVKDKSAFGDAASMFEGINEDELQDKLKTTLENITDFFKTLDPEGEESEEGFADFLGQASAQASSAETGRAEPTDVPDAENIHDHLKGLFEGKIGHLAKELAEEISHDVEHLFDDELGAGGKDDIRSTNDLIKKMIKNPKKIMGLMKTISGKLQDKMKSGEISEQDIMKEAGDLMGKMKDMKGMGDMGEMFKHLAKGMGGKGGINMGALAKMQRQMGQRERMLSKLEERKAAAASTPAASTTFHIDKTTDPNHMVFRVDDDDEKPEYSSAVPPSKTMTDAELVSMFEKSESTGVSSKIEKKDKKKKKSKK